MSMLRPFSSNAKNIALYVAIIILIIGAAMAYPIYYLVNKNKLDSGSGLVLRLVNPKPIIQDLSPINSVNPPPYSTSILLYNWPLMSKLSDSNTQIIITFTNLSNILSDNKCICSFYTKLYSTVDNDNITITMSIPSDNETIFNPKLGLNYIIPKANTIYNLIGEIYFNTTSTIQTYKPLILTINSLNKLGIQPNINNTFLSITK